MAASSIFLRSLRGFLTWNLQIPYVHPGVLALTLILGSLLYQPFYNRYLHPLRKHPGPIFGGLTDFYKLYALWRKHIPTLQLELHKQHGPIIRLAPNLLSISSPYMLPAVYHRYADKSDFYIHAIMGEDAPTFQTLDHREHAARRRIIAPSLSMTNIRRYEARMSQQVKRTIAALRQKFAISGQPFDFADWSRWYLQDSANEVTFGEPMGAVERCCDVNGVISSLHRQALLAGLIASLPWLINPIVKHPFLKGYLLPHSGDNTGTGKLMQYRDTVFNDRLTTRKLARKAALVDDLQEAKLAEGTAVDPKEVKTEVLAIMIATTDTTAAFISAFVNKMVENPKVLSTLMAEISGFEAAERLSSPVVSFDETEELTFFKACIQEVLRHSPSTPIILPRIVSQGGIVLNDIFIPEGTEIGANPYVINRDTEVFGHDADDFRPGRWLENPQRTKEMNKWMFTWGWGPRDCVGRHFARLVSQKFCLQLFRDFHIFQASSGGGRSNDRGLCIYEGQWLVIKERNTNTA